MKKNLNLPFVIFATALLSGCAGYPLPISEPSAMVIKKADDGTEKEEKRKPDYQRGGLLPATHIVEGKDNLKIYGDWYRQVADKLRAGEYQNSDFVFGGGVLAALGGLANSQGAAIAGAAASSGASLISQRYQAQVQAANYDRAGDAMYCMYRIVSPLNPELIENSRLANVEHERIRKSLVAVLNERIDEVRLKLRDSQSKVILSVPDTKQLEEAIKAAQGKKGQVATQQAGHDVDKAIDASRLKEKSARPTMAAEIDQRSSPTPAENEYFSIHLPVVEDELSKCTAKL